MTWEHQPAHFWLVLASALLSFLLGLLMAEAAGRRGDARVLLVSLAFLSASGFLGLHALATPGVLLAGKNAGFQIASAIGLLIGAGFAAASALPFSEQARWPSCASAGSCSPSSAVRSPSGRCSRSERSRRSTSRSRPRRPRPAARPLGLGVLLYGYAAYRYGRLCIVAASARRAGRRAAWVLLAEAMLAVAISRNWQVTWWEWHLLMLLAFALVARSVWVEWQREGSSAEIFADLYEERTLGRREQVSVLFADLQGFTTFAERTPPDDVRAMLNEYFATVARPSSRSEDGELVQTVGDADLRRLQRRAGHEARAARAGLAAPGGAAPRSPPPPGLAALSRRGQLGRGPHRPRPGAGRTLLHARPATSSTRALAWSSRPGRARW